MTNATGPRARIYAGGTRLRRRGLHVMGHGSARIARALGVREETIRRLVRGDTALISPTLRDTITDLYDAWWDKRAPERTRAERAAATAARRRAAAGNWCAPSPSTTTGSTPCIQSWAEELGLTVPDAIAQAHEPSRDINRQQEQASPQPDREAAD
jgi:hypothetical protein